MIARNAKIYDLMKLRQMHSAMKMAYNFPDLTDELTAVSTVIDDGNIIAGGAVKIIGESYLWIDPRRSVNDRLTAISLLDADMAKNAKLKGFSSVSAWIPPEVHGAFTKLIEDLGWRKSPWPTWTRSI
jgi:hypothetical protein